jgi:predicted regulator of Ras-like GTPase activity (Roadblock/LC7/MglB family)
VLPEVGALRAPRSGYEASTEANVFCTCREGWATKREALDNYRTDVDRYRRLLEREPGSLRFAEFADRLRRDGKIPDATVICARGLAHNPSYATGHVVMGDIFRDAGLPDKAEAEWREGLRLDTTHPQAYLRLGELHLSRGEPEQAAAMLEVALLHNPGLAEAQATLAEARKRLSGEGGAEQNEAASARRRRPGERPPWLTSERFEKLVEAVADCRSVEAAALVNLDGLLLEGNMPVPGRLGGGAGVAADLVAEARDLMRRLAGGRLRAALVQGEGGSLYCLALGDLTLAATLRPGAQVGTAKAELEGAIATASRPGRRGNGVRS